MGRNTWVHESNSRNLSVKLSLTQLSKNALSSFLCLCLFFNKINKKGRTGPALELTGEGVEKGGAGWRNDPNNVCTCE
jgi:hypothetical protein